MITEDYVSFETAKLLKEKGFDEPCECFYDTGNNDVSIVNGWMDISNSELEEREFVCYSAPTLQMAMKWLREVHNIFIDIVSRFSMNADKDVCFSYSCKKLIGTYKSCYEHSDGEWWNYEDACEAAIKYCLENLI